LSDIHFTALFTHCIVWHSFYSSVYLIVLWHSSYGSIYLIVLSDIHFTALFTSL
jgi:hypothetical protein